jgi:hypothetical protein
MRTLCLLLLSGSLAFGQAFTFGDVAFLAGLSGGQSWTYRSLWVSNTELKNAVLFMDANNTTTNYLGTNYATINGTFNYAAGIVNSNSAFDFGSGDSWLSLPSYAGLENITNAFTAEWWAKATGSATDYCMFTRDDVDLVGYILGRGVEGDIQTVFSVNGGTWGTYIPYTFTVPNSWTHLAVVFETTGLGQSTLRFYTDGVESSQYAFEESVSMSYNTAPLLISAYSGDNYHFDGLLDEVAFYATNLTSDQILKIYQAGTNGSSKRFSSY